jgi:hypothetical protein
MNPHAQSEHPPVQQTLIDLGLPVTAILGRKVVHRRKQVRPEISPEAYRENLKPPEEECPF